MNNRQYFKTASLQMLFGLLLFQITSVLCQERNNGAIQEDESVIAWMGDDALVTLDDVEQYKNQMISENPQLEEYIKMISADEINRSIGELLLQQDIVDIYIEKSKIAQQADYQKDLDIAIKMATTTVNNKYFTQEIAASISPTEKELRAFYDTHKKTIPGIQKERGGIKTVGVSFDSEAEAKAFLKKVNTKDLSQIATGEDLEVRDFGLVSKSSMNVDGNILDAVLAMTKFPQTVTVVDMDGTVWVIQGASKKEDSFYSYDEVKDLVKDRALQYQIAEKISDKLNDLKQEYKVTINEEFFGGVEPLTINEEDVETLIEELEEEGL